MAPLYHPAEVPALMDIMNGPATAFPRSSLDSRPRSALPLAVMTDTPYPTAVRHPDHPVDPIFITRWSPRAFDRSVLPDADLMTIFEAARWAPSAFNYQPWRLLY